MTQLHAHRPHPSAPRPRPRAHKPAQPGAKRVRRPAGDVRARLAAAGIDDATLRQVAARHGVPADLLLRVIRQESGGNPRARSKAGAMGLMQLMPGTARHLGVRNAWDPRQNLEGGAKYLGQMLRMFKGNTHLALAAYNAGPGAVRKAGGVPNIRETRNYVAAIAGPRTWNA